MEKIFYLANAFNGLSKLCTLFFVISLLACIVLIIATCVQETEYGKDDDIAIVCKKWAVRTGVLLIISFIGQVLVPDKETYILMKGGQIVEEAYNNSETLQELPKNTAEFLNEYVKTLTKELKENNPE